MNYERIEKLKEILETGKYTIDPQTGVVYSVYLGKEKSSVLDGAGYLNVGLNLHGKTYMYKNHELVAFANGMDILDKTIDHLDGDKLNNSPSNLEPITREENISRRHLMVRTGKHVNTLTRKRIKAIECCYKNGFGKDDLAEIFNAPIESINNIINELINNEVNTAFDEIVATVKDDIKDVIKKQLNIRLQ